MTEAPLPTRIGYRQERLDHLRRMASYPDGPTLNNEAVRFIFEEVDRLTVLAKAATDVYRRLHRAQDYREKEALWSALEAAVEAVNG